MTRHSPIWLGGTLLAVGAMLAAFALGLRNSVAGFLGLGLASILVLTLRDVHGDVRINRSRQLALQQVASEIEYSFRESVPCSALDWPESFLLSQDHTRGLRSQCRNVMERSIADAAVAILDYEYDKAGSEATARLTVFSLRSAKLSFRHFALVPASLWDRLLASLGRNVVLSNGYRMITDDADVSARFDPKLFTHLAGGTCLEAGEGVLLLYRRGSCAAPHEIGDLITNGLQIFAMLCSDSELVGSAT